LFLSDPTSAFLPHSSILPASIFLPDFNNVQSEEKSGSDCSTSKSSSYLSEPEGQTVRVGILKKDKKKVKKEEKKI
jgi:hypothetical protein